MIKAENALTTLLQNSLNIKARNSLSCSINLATILVSCVQRLLRVTERYSKILQHSVDANGKDRVIFLCVLIRAQVMYHLTYLYEVRDIEKSVYEESTYTIMMDTNSINIHSYGSQIPSPTNKITLSAFTHPHRLIKSMALMLLYEGNNMQEGHNMLKTLKIQFLFYSLFELRTYTTFL